MRVAPSSSLECSFFAQAALLPDMPSRSPLLHLAGSWIALWNGSYLPFVHGSCLPFLAGSWLPFLNGWHLPSLPDSPHCLWLGRTFRFRMGRAPRLVSVWVILAISASSGVVLAVFGCLVPSIFGCFIPSIFGWVVPFCLLSWTLLSLLQ